jgi:hypothetical protein
MRRIVVTSRLLCACILGLLPATLSASTPSSVEDGLKAFLAGWTPPAQLVITYDDLNSFHGGLRIRVSGTGDVEQEAVRQSALASRKLTPSEVRRLVNLLLEIKSWQQVTPERAPVPDESRAYLTVRVAASEATIWEWYNDRLENQRIIRVVKLLEEMLRGGEK